MLGAFNSGVVARPSPGLRKPQSIPNSDSLSLVLTPSSPSAGAQSTPRPDQKPGERGGGAEVEFERPELALTRDSSSLLYQPPFPF